VNTSNLKKCYFFALKSFESLRKNKWGFKNDCDFLNFIISVRIGHCDYSHREPKMRSYATVHRK
jgi:hypothetical protein